MYWPDLTEEAIVAAREEKIETIPIEETAGGAPEVLTLARQVLRQAAGDEALGEGGYSVHTTIDIALQRAAREALQRGLRAIDERQGYRGPYATRRKRGPKPSPNTDRLRMGRTYVARVVEVDDEKEQLWLEVAGHRAVLRMRDIARHNPKDLSAAKFTTAGDLLPVSITQLGTDEDPAVARPERGPEGAIVVIEPRSRDVLALIGGYEARSGFNRATQAISSTR